ncbi:MULTISPECIES: hypothetical protein [unclassified Streptomyces]|uniref:hypothetical protein n=1 Tax=unclassified Streptomyces TaxID=2593676 RepID=UPI0028850405|nr:hypothetical protein [Streptomyces sp. DSM 41633]
MTILRSTTRVAAVAAAAVGMFVFASSPASAFSQSWGSGSYHASGDFVPSSGSIRIGGSGCSGGAARSFYTQLVKTSGSSKVFSSYSYAADGQYQTDPRGIGVSTSTSYYLRWYGKNNSGSDASAPCASAHTA